MRTFSTTKCEAFYIFFRCEHVGNNNKQFSLIYLGFRWFFTYSRMVWIERLTWRLDLFMFGKRFGETLKLFYYLYKLWGLEDWGMHRIVDGPSSDWVTKYFNFLLKVLKTKFLTSQTIFCFAEITDNYAQLQVSTKSSQNFIFVEFKLKKIQNLRNDDSAFELKRKKSNGLRLFIMFVIFMWLNLLTTKKYSSKSN